MKENQTISMNYLDKTLICKNCQAEFIWTSGEQKFFEEKGLQNIPLRCTDCRKLHKKGKKPGGRAVEVKCEICGKTGQIGFPVLPEEKIYCQECFSKAKEKGLGA